MTMAHSDKVNQHLSDTWPYRHEWCCHDPSKKIGTLLVGSTLLTQGYLRRHQIDSAFDAVQKLE